MDALKATVPNDVLRLWLASASKGLPISAADETERVPLTVEIGIVLFVELQVHLDDPIN